MLEKLKEKWIETRDKLEYAAAAAIPQDRAVPEEIAKERYAICSGCEFLYYHTDTCKKCGCFMKIKVTLANQHCPIFKWDRYKKPENTESTNNNQE